MMVSRCHRPGLCRYSQNKTSSSLADLYICVCQSCRVQEDARLMIQVMDIPFSAPSDMSYHSDTWHSRASMKTSPVIIPLTGDSLKYGSVALVCPNSCTRRRRLQQTFPHNAVMMPQRARLHSSGTKREQRTAVACFPRDLDKLVIINAEGAPDMPASFQSRMSKTTFHSSNIQTNK